jgi:hypothetical protein
MITAPKTEIRKEYIRLLPNYSVFSRIANNNSVKPFILIQNIRPTLKTTKDSEGYEVEVTLMIVTDYQGDTQADDISSYVQKAIINGITGCNAVLTDFYINRTEVTKNESVGDIIVTPTQMISNQILVIKHNIIQKL